MFCTILPTNTFCSIICKPAYTVHPAGPSHCSKCQIRTRKFFTSPCSRREVVVPVTWCSAPTGSFHICHLPLVYYQSYSMFFNYFLDNNKFFVVVIASNISSQFLFIFIRWGSIALKSVTWPRGMVIKRRKEATIDQKCGALAKGAKF